MASTHLPMWLIPDTSLLAQCLSWFVLLFWIPFLMFWVAILVILLTFKSRDQAMSYAVSHIWLIVLWAQVADFSYSSCRWPSQHRPSTHFWTDSINGHVCELGTHLCHCPCKRWTAYPFPDEWSLFTLPTFIRGVLYAVIPLIRQ